MSENDNKSIVLESVLSLFLKIQGFSYILLFTIMCSQGNFTITITCKCTANIDFIEGLILYTNSKTGQYLQNHSQLQIIVDSIRNLSGFGVEIQPWDYFKDCTVLIRKVDETGMLFSSKYFSIHVRWASTT